MIEPWPRPNRMAGVQGAVLPKYFSNSSLFRASRARAGPGPDLALHESIFVDHFSESLSQRWIFQSRRSRVNFRHLKCAL
jgi:hypothetical protein